MVSVPVALVALFAHRLSGGSGSAATYSFCIQPKAAAGSNFYVNVRMGVWYSCETWWNTGLLSFLKDSPTCLGDGYCSSFCASNLLMLLLQLQISL